MKPFTFGSDCRSSEFVVSYSLDVANQQMLYMDGKSTTENESNAVVEASILVTHFKEDTK